MTSTPHIVERLLATESAKPEWHNGPTTCWHRNPDGPEAAAEIERLQSVITAYEAALTPSEETKIAYMGEFTIPWPVVGEDGDDHIISIDVPWTTIKEIMAAIRELSSKGTQP